MMYFLKFKFKYLTVKMYFYLIYFRLKPGIIYDPFSLF